jgi:hypothetical protein
MPAKNRHATTAQVGQIDGTIKDMPGTLRVHAVLINGQAAVLTELPNGISFGLGPRGDAGILFHFAGRAPHHVPNG